MAELENLALRDPLTGAFNRRHFDSVLSLVVRAHRRLGRPVSVLVADIDDFKRINDTGGHAAGDDVLRAFVDMVGRTARPSDTLARLGGDERVDRCGPTHADVGVGIGRSDDVSEPARPGTGSPWLYREPLLALTLAVRVASGPTPRSQSRFAESERTSQE